MIKIWCPQHVRFAADILCENLIRLGQDACITSKIDAYDDCLYLIYNASSAGKLPANYIVYQTEVAESKWFTPDYLKRIKRAQAIWEYDPANIHKYKHVNSKVHLVSPGFESQPVQNKDIPVLFYGYIGKSEHRKNLLSELSKQIEIRVVADKLGDDMWELLSRTETVLNLHYYESAPLETFRINEALSFGCRVVSQSSPNMSEKYQGIVSFADTAEQILRALREKADGGHGPLHALDNFAEVERALQSPVALKPARKSIFSSVLGITDPRSANRG